MPRNAAAAASSRPADGLLHQGIQPARLHGGEVGHVGEVLARALQVRNGGPQIAPQALGESVEPAEHAQSLPGDHHEGDGLEQGREGDDAEEHQAQRIHTL